MKTRLDVDGPGVRSRRWPLAVGAFVAACICLSPTDLQSSWIGLLAVPGAVIAGRQTRQFRGTRAFSAWLMLFIALLVNLVAATLVALVPSPPSPLLEGSLWRSCGTALGALFAFFVIRSEHLGLDQTSRSATGAGTRVHRTIRPDTALLLESAAVAAGMGLLVWVFVIEPFGALHRYSAPLAFPAVWTVIDASVAIATGRAWQRVGSGRGPHLYLWLMQACGAAGDACMVAGCITTWDWFWTGTCLLYTLGIASLVQLEIDPRFRVAGVPATAAVPVPRGLHLTALCALLVPVALLPFYPAAADPVRAAVRAALVVAVVGLVVSRFAYGGLQLLRLDEDARWRAGHDSLTGLSSRFAFLGEVTRRLAGVGPTAGTALLFIDLDGFKAVNDTRGHDVGDALLVEVAQRVRSAVRSIDWVGRIGGDEFVVLLGEADVQFEDASRVAQRIADLLAEPISETSPAAGCAITASIGGCLAQGSVSCDDMLATADEIMYSVKRNGKNGVAWTRISSAPHGLAPSRPAHQTEPVEAAGSPHPADARA